MTEKMKRGEMTAFISLVFVLLVGLIGAVIESASVQTAKNYRREDMDRALQSVFAEYHRELLSEYDIFGIAAGYETGTFCFENIVNRLEFYEAAGMTQEPEKLQLLTDDHGQPFKEQAVRYMKSRMGVDLVEELTGNCAVWEEQSQQSGSYEEQGSDISQELDSKLQEGESELPSENNPLENISNIKKSNLLQIVVSNPEQGDFRLIVTYKKELEDSRQKVMHKVRFLLSFSVSIFWSILEMQWIRRRKIHFLMKWNIFWKEKRVISKI